MDNENGINEYTMTISRTTIDKLGVKLYDNVAAAIGELIANSYDADATVVAITLPMGKWLAKKTEKGEIPKYKDLGYEIKIVDNGHGMIPMEIDDKYLKVGRERRKEHNGHESPKYGRAVMGRKGIGKLAPFGICKEIEVMSAGGKKTAKGYKTAHFILEYDKILADTSDDYHPKLGDLDATYTPQHGTAIILRNFYHRRISSKEKFHDQLARRFGIPTKHWKINLIDILEQGVKFTVGDLDIEILEDTRIVVDEDFSTEDGDKLHVEGWVAYAKQAYKDKEMAGIRIFARHKIVAQTIDFGRGTGFTGENTARSYLVGKLTAEWIDLDEGEDLTRTSRDDILWNTDWGQAFQKWGQKLITGVAKSGVDALSKKTWKIFLEKSNIEKIAEERLKDRTLRHETIRVAQLLGRTITLEALEDDTFVANLRDLAFMIAPNKMLVETLNKIGQDTTSPFETIVRLFDQARIAEIASYGQIVAGRLGAIAQLEQRLNNKVTELNLQKIIEEAPWILNPQWIPLTQNQMLETFREEFEKWYEQKYGEKVLTSKIKYPGKRPDFILLSFESAIQVVEIKPKGHKFNKTDYGRLERYFIAMEAFWNDNKKIQNIFPNGVKFILICDGIALHRREQDAFQHYIDSEKLSQHNWNEIITNTKTFHEDFREAARQFGS